MEEDRAATNLGPEVSDLPLPGVSDTQKQPRKRFIGRRAAAERTSSQEQNSNASDTLQAPRSARTPRILNQVPKDILEDPDILAAIAHLPSNYNFEIPKTIHRIRSSQSKNIALQFPEGLLLFAPLISDILTRFCPGTDTLIMGDVTYGACCIDDYTARALGCDLLVHYGHSCLVPMDQTGGIKTLYVFVTIGIDVEHLIRTIEANFQPGKKIALVGTIQFNTTLHAISPRLRSSGYEILLPRSAPLSAGEILGCTAPTLVSRSKPNPSTTSAKTTIAHQDADMILYIGDGRFHLESILIASPSLRAHTYRYDPYSRRLTHESYEHEEMHDLRRHAIQTARRTLAIARKGAKNAAAGITEMTGEEPSTWGIILGTLGRQGNPHTLSLIQAHLERLGVECITLLLSEIQPGKIALMSRDVGVWLQIACPRLSIDWGYAFERPLLSPYEACVALGIREGGAWVGKEEGGIDAERGNENIAQAVGEGETAVYPMDFYGKDGLGRTRAEDVPSFPLEIQVR